jgi:peptidoglycan-N-acetylmuramic acid deacetylase
VRKLKLLIMCAAVITMVGCGSSAANVDIQDVEKTAETSAGSESSITQHPSEKNEVDIKDKEDNSAKKPVQEAAYEPEHSVIQPGHQPEPKSTPIQGEVKGEKLSFGELDKLSNTRYSWYYKPADGNKVPGIPSDAARLISKHGGIFTGDTSKKVVYLTFDEGYENGYTSQILDTLKENNAKAMFFVTGPYINKNEDLIRRMLDEGHEVGNHTVNHPSLPGVDNKTLEKELYGLEQQFEEKFGTKFKYMRPPMGEYSERVLAAAQQLGYKTVFWSFAYRDWEVDKQKGPDHAYNMVMDNIHNGAVLLLHAVSSDNAQALDRIIKDIRARGYEIRPFDL